VTIAASTPIGYAISGVFGRGLAAGTAMSTATP
jgi:hypothetical protein